MAIRRQRVRIYFCLTRSGLPSLVRGHSTDNIEGDVYNSSFKTEGALVRGELTRTYERKT